MYKFLAEYHPCLLILPKFIFDFHSFFFAICGRNFEVTTTTLYDNFFYRLETIWFLYKIWKFHRIHAVFKKYLQNIVRICIIQNNFDNCERILVFLWINYLYQIEQRQRILFSNIAAYLVKTLIVVKLILCCFGSDG